MARGGNTQGVLVPGSTHCHPLVRPWPQAILSWVPSCWDLGSQAGPPGWCVWLLVCSVVPCHPKPLTSITSRPQMQVEQGAGSMTKSLRWQPKAQASCSGCPLFSMDVFLTTRSAVGCQPVPRQPLCHFWLRNHLQTWQVGYFGLAPNGATWPLLRTGPHSDREGHCPLGWVMASSHGVSHTNHTEGCRYRQCLIKAQADSDLRVSRSGFREHKLTSVWCPYQGERWWLMLRISLTFRQPCWAEDVGRDYSKWSIPSATVKWLVIFSYMHKVIIELVAQSCPTHCNSTDCSLPASSVHGILQARILEWIPIPFSRGSSWLRKMHGRCAMLHSTQIKSMGHS